MSDFVANYRQFATKLGEDIITWARPEGWPASPTQVSDMQLLFCLRSHLNNTFHLVGLAIGEI